MKILQVCHKPPYPPVEGGSIATYQLTTGLMELGCKVDVLAMNTYKQYCDIGSVPAEFVSKTNYQLVDMDIRVQPLAAFLNLFTTQSYNISRFKSTAFANQLGEILKKNDYDVIILESLYTTPYIHLIRDCTKAFIVLRSHNIEHQIWKRLGSKEKNKLKKTYLNLLAHRLKKFELKAIQQVDLIASISEADTREFKNLGCTVPIGYVPFGINFQEKKYQSPPPIEINKPVLFHVGSMEWLPHQEAFKWFFDFVWPKFHKKNPQVELHLAGTNMPSWMLEQTNTKVKLTNGYVEGKDFMKDKSIMVVPSFSGSGIRVKIIEGMAMGKVIITTHNGIQGIPVKNGEHAYISDHAEEWVNYLTNLVQQPTVLKTISVNAQTFAEKEFNHLAAADELLHLINVHAPKTSKSNSQRN